MDYILNPTDLTFPSGSQQGTRVCTNVDIIDDEFVEYTETVYVNLTTNDVKVRILSAVQQKRIFIHDNDGETIKLAIISIHHACNLQ